MKTNWQIVVDTILINIGLIIVCLVVVIATNKFLEYITWYSEVTVALLIYTLLGNIANVLYARNQSKINIHFRKVTMIPAFLISNFMIFMYIFIIIGGTLNSL